jgi:hypothetical protein
MNYKLLYVPGFKSKENNDFSTKQQAMIENTIYNAWLKDH